MHTSSIAVPSQAYFQQKKNLQCTETYCSTHNIWSDHNLWTWHCNKRGGIPFFGTSFEKISTRNFSQSWQARPQNLAEHLSTLKIEWKDTFEVQHSITNKKQKGKMKKKDNIPMMNIYDKFKLYPCLTLFHTLTFPQCPKSPVPEKE